MSAYTAKLEAFFEEFRAFRAGARARRLARIGDFLRTFEEVQQEAVGFGLTDFNIFSLLGVETDEVRHTRILAWLLDARAEHRAGNVFLKALVDLCGLGLPAEVLERYKVRREFWVAESRVDVVVYRQREFVIYLENKVYAEEGPAQVERELGDMNRWGEALRVPEGRRFGIFLTPEGRRPRSGDAKAWKVVSYKEVARRFEELVERVKTEKGRLLLRDWIEIALRLGG